MNTGENKPQAAEIWRFRLGDARKEALRVDFDSPIKLDFHGATVTNDAGRPRGPWGVDVGVRASEE